MTYITGMVWQGARDGCPHHPPYDTSVEGSPVCRECDAVLVPAGSGPGSDRWPNDGEWPCQTEPGDLLYQERLVAFLYRLLRDVGPGVIEEHAIAVRVHNPGEKTTYTNPHLERYAQSLATYLLGK